MLRILIVFGLGAGLLACSSSLHQVTPVVSTSINSDLGTDATMDSMIAPYSRELSAEMNVVLGTSKFDLIVGRPSSSLGNWTTDALLQYAQDSMQLTDLPVIVLLNTGGLRASLSKGDITVGDIFKLMPFDNTLVILKCKRSILDAVQAYLFKTGGEPISGMFINRGVLSLVPLRESEEIYIITSDFLANGGDKMDFLKQAIETRLTGILIRDIFMNAVKKQQILIGSTEERITW
jgi:2',3'-cyclic-nucleotide 2'-phosphodiesterase (5'-nucleotidase family)